LLTFRSGGLLFVLPSGLTAMVVVVSLRHGKLRRHHRQCSRGT
jgi:hypothetical protein